jgi:hypothetical protein
LFVSGSPTLPGNRLTAEFQSANGEITTVPFAGTDPHEAWACWQLTPPAGATALRLHATDGSVAFRGWLAFTEPYAEDLALTISARMIAQVFCAVALACVLVLGPGLCWRTRPNRTLLDVL